MWEEREQSPEGESVVALEPQLGSLTIEPAPFLLHSGTLRALLPHLWEPSLLKRTAAMLTREAEAALTCRGRNSLFWSMSSLSPH